MNTGVWNICRHYYIGKDIADIVGVGTVTVERVRKQCVLEGVEAGWKRTVQVNHKKCRLDGEATLTMLACSTPLQGHTRWSLIRLNERLWTRFLPKRCAGHSTKQLTTVA